ncbi:hypothetical protein [Streptomyces sp. NPDC055140]
MVAIPGSYAARFWTHPVAGGQLCRGHRGCDLEADPSARSRSKPVVEGPGQLSVGRSRRLRFLCPLVEFALLGGDLLFKEADAAVELVDVDGCPEAVFGPDGIAELVEERRFPS